MLEAPGGVELYWEGWQPPAVPRGVVVLIHGLAEHAGRYHVVADFLVGAGFGVVTYDQRGHGRSGGKPAFVNHFDEFLADLVVLLREVVGARAGDRPIILWGHSMGGLVSLRYLQAHPGNVAGAVISAPWLATKTRPPKWKVALSRVLNTIAPDDRVPVRLAPETLTRDPERQRAYRDDPLVRRFVTPGLYWAVADAQKSALAHPEKVEGPVLFLVPDADPVVDPETTLAFAEGAAGPGLESYRLDGLLHEPHNEPEREEVFAIVRAWLGANFPSTDEP